MFLRLAFLLASLHLVLVQSQDNLIINTPPSAAQCLPTLLTFAGGSPPYTISAIPAGQVSAAPLVQIGTATGNDLTWNTNLRAGTSISLMIRDSKGVLNYSQAITIQPSGSTDCLNATGPTPTGPSNPVTTGVVPPPPSTPGKDATNSTPPTSSQNKTNTGAAAGVPPANAGGSNSSAQTKGPSPFVTNPTNGSIASTSPANNAANSAAPSALPTNLGSCIAGIAAVGSALMLFA